MKPTIEGNEGYMSVIPDQPVRLSIDSNLSRTPISCPFQAPCWKNIRAPLARRGYVDETGVKRKVYMPYICSYSSEGDLESCSHYQRFKSEEERDKINAGSGNISTDGSSRNNI